MNLTFSVNNSCLTLSFLLQEVANGFHNPPKVIIPDCLSGPYPSHIKFNLLPRAQGKGMGESLITCVLESLKNKGLNNHPSYIRQGSNVS